MFEQHPGFYYVKSVHGAEMFAKALEEVKNEPTVSTEKGVEYINTPNAYDIETSSFLRPEDGEKVAIMYIWQLGINGYAFYGRTWEEFQTIMDVLRDCLKLSPKRRLVIYVHNLAYEFAFIKKRFKWIDMFCIRRRKPIYAVTESGIEFRCSYIESGYSLANVGKNLLKYKVKKMEGDLYYSLIRHSGTPLSRKQLKYCENDIRVVMSHIQEEIETNGSIISIPKTNTGRVREFARVKCLGDEDFQKLIKKLRISGTGDSWKQADEKQYDMMNLAFRGGDVEANPGAVASGKTYFNVMSKDITSSYPTVMISEKYPMSRGRLVDLHGDKNLFLRLLKTKCCIFSIEFENLRPRVYNAFYLNSYNCKDPTGKNKNEWKIENGNVVSAPVLRTCITNVDFDIIEQNYKWDRKKIGSFYVYDAEYLPKPLIECVLTLYEKKTTLKGVSGMEAEYMHYKGMLNSLYGMIVTRFIRDIVNFDFEEGEWEEDTPADVMTELEKYNRGYNRFLFFPWGVFVTAYARRNLFKAVFEVGADFLYCDTDSVKYLNYKNHEEFFKNYNEEITRKIRKVLEFYEIDADAAAPCDKKGKRHPLGIYDDDGFYEKFKTLGAKRYLTYSDGEYHLTVAGVPKDEGMKAILRQAKRAGKDPFEIFEVGLEFSAKSIGHITDFFQDKELSGSITDYRGETADYHEYSGIYMSESDYCMTGDPVYQCFLEQLLGGWDSILDSATT